MPACGGSIGGSERPCGERIGAARGGGCRRDNLGSQSLGGTDDGPNDAYFSPAGTRSSSELALAPGAYVVMVEQLNAESLEFVLSAYFRVEGVDGSLTSDKATSQGCVSWEAFASGTPSEAFDHFQLPSYKATYREVCRGFGLSGVCGTGAKRQEGEGRG